jgi:hypothetical protein
MGGPAADALTKAMDDRGSTARFLASGALHVEGTYQIW